MPPTAVIWSLLVFDDKHPLYNSYRIAKRIAIGIVGGSVLVVGVCMIVLPGPAFIVIPVGLGILGIEFAWARIWLKKVKAKAQAVTKSFTNRNGRDEIPPPGPPPGR
ncbi:MAG: PGPGW domain-containing protein [Steroidobacteraceae bacterium]|nr:PGPGW domain-containing protein [Steroidobacteraceae bacterium]